MVVVLFFTLFMSFFTQCIGKEPASQCRSRKRRKFNPWVRKIPWRRAWQPTSVLLPGESHGQRSLAGYSPQSHKMRHDWSNLACTDWSLFNLIQYPVYRWGKWGPARLRDVPGNTQLVMDEPATGTQVSWTPVQFLLPPFGWLCMKYKSFMWIIFLMYVIFVPEKHIPLPPWKP